ncbi:MAG: ATP-dependent DNA helicase [Myxococcota bacterium]
MDRARAALDPWLRAVGPLALIEGEVAASGRGGRSGSAMGALGVVLLDPGDPSLLAGRVRGDGLRGLRRVLAGRALVLHDGERLRARLARDVDPMLAARPHLELQSLFALAHPDAPDLELDTLCQRLLGRAAAADALARAIDLGRLLAATAIAARSGAVRHVELRPILAARLPGSPWRALVDPDFAPIAEGAAEQRLDFTAFAKQAFAAQRREPGAAASPDPVRSASVPPSPSPLPAPGEGRYLVIGASDEAPVPFEIGAISAALADAERGRRHFPGYRVRKEQIELARQFVHVLQDGGVAKLEGGTGVGKSLAYLAAVIPFAVARAETGEREPVVLSTRTKLLQDQLLNKDIAAAARFLGHPGLRALSIKGRANYVCERRLAAVLADGGDPALLGEWQADFAQLEACARIRPAGEVGTVPAVLHRMHPRLRELLRGSVAARADQCSREQCAHERRCPFGRHRRALAKAHLVVANHDLLLRWPPDYPAFSHVVADEGHELGGVAEEVYSIRIRPEEIEERLEVLFGSPARRGQRRFATRGLVADPPTRSGAALLERNRSDLRLELSGLGHQMAAQADGFGGAELPSDAGRARPAAARLAAAAAERLEALAGHALREGPARRFETGESGAGKPIEGLRNLAAEEEAQRSIASHAEALLSAANGLRMAFAVDNEAYVGAFEGLEAPYDRWSLVLRPVDPGPSFREEFLGKVESLAVVSATLFVGGDDHAALGEIGLADDEDATHFRYSVPSPFPYARAMRVVALEGSADLVEDTALALATLARTLGGRTLGLFTSLARMREVAERLEVLLADEGLEILVPLRASDDPGGLVERFRKLHGAAVMLGSRRYWQGIDVRGDDLQAVVIEKLPFDVPTELRRRRDLRLRAAGEDPFARASLGRMLLHLKQMAGRLIRSETDRGLVVIVDARRDRGYFRRLADAFPDGVAIEREGVDALPRIAAELGLGVGLERGADARPTIDASPQAKPGPS